MPSAGSGVSPAREGVRESRGSGGTSPFPLILWPERSGREPRAPLRGVQKDDRASKKKLPLPPAYNPSVTFGDSSPYTGEPKGAAHPSGAGREQRAPLRGVQKDDHASKKKLPLPPAYNPSVTFGDSSPYTGEPKGAVHPSGAGREQRAPLRRTNHDEPTSQSNHMPCRHSCPSGEPKGAQPSNLPMNKGF